MSGPGGWGLVVEVEVEEEETWVAEGHEERGTGESGVAAQDTGDGGGKR